MESPRKKIVPVEDDENDFVESMRQAMKFEIPTVGGHLVEPLTNERLLRYLRASKFDANQAALLYKRCLDYRISRLGFGPVEVTSSVVKYVKGAQDDEGRPRVLLRLDRLDLSDEGFEGRYAAHLWRAIEDALDSGKSAQIEGIVLVVDARQASPKKFLRPRRLRFLAETLSTPAAVARVEIFRANAWTYWLLTSLVARLFSDDVEVVRLVEDTMPEPLREELTN